MLVANGAIWLDTKLLFSGMWSAGRGPVEAKLVKFNAVMTFRTTTSCVASTYRLWSRGNIRGSSSRVALVEELCTSIGVWVSRATSSWMYPIPWTREKGEPKEESYL